MRAFNVFRELTTASSRLGFHTSESSDSIPEQSGCYAWMFPLWIYRDSLDTFLNLASNLLNYEPLPIANVDLPFSWENIELDARRRPKMRHTEAKITIWNRILEDKESRSILQQTLLEASLFMPPLYVGMTENLKRRYLEHTHGDNSERNTFHKRLTQSANSLGLKISVHDLLFVSIATPPWVASSTDRVTSDEFNGLVEQIMMQICRPPFSER